MNLFVKRTDGGPESNVTGYWLIEWKNLFSIALLRFSKGSREAFHSHAFHAVSWVLSGKIEEHRIGVIPRREKITEFHPSLKPIITTKNNMHKVYGISPTTWVLTFRGPWTKTWKEHFEDGRDITLTHGRQVVEPLAE
jgi:hypothetical protein